MLLIFAITFWTREQPADLAYDQLLDKAKSHKTAVVEYNHDKESRQKSMGFPHNCLSIHAVLYNDPYNQCSPFRTCGRCGLTHNSLGCCPASSAQCSKYGHLNHWQCMCGAQMPSRSPSRRRDNKSGADIDTGFTIEGTEIIRKVSEKLIWVY